MAVELAGEQCLSIEPMRATRRLIFRWFLLTSSILVGTCAYRGLRWDPRFTMNRLGGLTPKQVISVLGPPTVDQRLQGWTPSDEKTGSFLHFFYVDPYGWEGQEYGITFSHNRVVEVRRATK